jgi:CDP-6-deoxy-D-xylo-4-hexulose-3-dehydrase
VAYLVSDPRDRIDELREQILGLAAEHQKLVADARPPFVPGRTVVPYAGRVYGESEVSAAVEASLEFWLTAGRWSRRFETALAARVGHEHARLVNSGSSANLVATAALTSPLLGDRRLRAGDEVLTVAAGFPTTVAPIVQLGLVPVFVDVTESTANVDVSQLADAVGPRTRAVILAHTLGNPFDLDAVTALCRAHDLFLIEDNCDALGSTYTSTAGDCAGQPRPTGSFGDIATSSFYPAHHITTGEGGAVYVTDADLERAISSIRDWGRDCWCAPGKSDTCGQRFEHCFAGLPDGYDHKYVYSHFGYNLKMGDLQAAIGVRQLDRLDDFTASRRANHRRLCELLLPVSDVLRLPAATPQSEPSWFAYLLVVRDGAPFTRGQLIAHLEDARIQTRMLFAGNVVQQPMFDEMRAAGAGYRVSGPLTVTDQLMRNALLVGCYPGLDDERIDYIAHSIVSFVTAHR